MALLVVGIATEIRVSSNVIGTSKTALEVVEVLVGAYLLFVVVPSILLQTAHLGGGWIGITFNPPIDVVASCSMLPVLHRGDIVILHGITNMSAFLEHHDIPVVNVSRMQFESMVSNMQTEFLEPFAYLNGSKSDLTQSIRNGTKYGYGLYNVVCLSKESQEETLAYDQCFVPENSQGDNFIKYNYSIAKLASNDGNTSTLYISSITIGNTSITENYSNPVIVYRTTSQDYFEGDIIHRAFAAIRVGGNYYILTKGDNNPVLDIEDLNYPVNSSNVLGYVVADIPVIGYASLILKGQIGSVAGCNQTIVR